MLTPTLALPMLGVTTVAKAVGKGAINPDEGKAWLDHLADLQRSGRFFSALTRFLVAGRK